MNGEENTHPRAFEGDPRHGTIVAGMAVGRTLGVAKKAYLIAMTLPPTWLPEDVKDMWRWAVNDVKTKHRTGKAVILFPHGMPQKFRYYFTFHHTNSF